MHDLLIISYYPSEEPVQPKTRKRTLVSFWLPKKLKNDLDAEVLRTDTDRSKIMRAALRHRLQRSA